MKILLELTPLSVNAAYRGRRFDSAAKKIYDYKLRLMLPKAIEPGPYYRVTYRFFLIRFESIDQQNLLKCLTDGIVKRGILKDDRYIVDERIQKFPSKQDRIEVEIENTERPVAP